MSTTHPQLKALDDLLTKLQFPIAAHSKDSYIEARRREDPSYEPMPYDRIDASQHIYQGPDGDLFQGQTFHEQWYAWFSSWSSARILELTITDFKARPWEDDVLLRRVEVKLVEDEDALDNDDFNTYGRQILVIRLELPQVNLPWEKVWSLLEQTLPSVDPSMYFDISEDDEDDEGDEGDDGVTPADLSR